LNRQQYFLLQPKKMNRIITTDLEHVLDMLHYIVGCQVCEEEENRKFIAELLGKKITNSEMKWYLETKNLDESQKNVFLDLNKDFFEKK
jgi:hypothetical protein